MLSLVNTTWLVVEVAAGIVDDCGEALHSRRPGSHAGRRNHRRRSRNAVTPHIRIRVRGAVSELRYPSIEQ
jgi:hypothetical protein